MFENPRRSRQARNFTTNAPKILDLKSSSEQIFSRKLPLGAPEFYSTRPVHSLTSKVFTEVSSCSKVINTFVDRPVQDWKARCLFHQSFPTFLHKIKYNDRCGTSRFLSPVSTVYARNACDHDTLLTNAQEQKREETLAFSESRCQSKHE